ncbi:protein FAM53B-like [Diretmus argenteus]
MVIIFSKTLEKKKAVNDVRSKNNERLLRELHTMSRGTTLFSCGNVEADRWLDLGRSCAIQRGPPCQSGASLESLWDMMPEQCQQRSRHWGQEPGSATVITSLIQDLSLGDSKLGSAHSHTTSPTTTTNHTPTAPPSKRQCRSLSFSDEFGGCRSSWRPQGSRVWTTVEKRRCHSGGSVRGAGVGFSSGHFPAMQRSSSFSSPSHSSIPTDGALELSCFTQRLPLHPLFTASPVSPTSPSSHHHHFHHHHFLRPLSLSHEQISLPELQREEEASEASSPDSTPELGRRAGQRAVGTGGLSRSRSQPCVLNDKKIGMKRRRPEDTQEQRPSLDLAKMTQKLQTFQSLSCPGISATVSCQSSLHPPSFKTTSQPDSDFTSMSVLGLEARQDVTRDEEEEDSSYEELDSDSACSVDSGSGSPVGIVDGKRTLWKGDCGTQRDIFQLGGELDLDQIERN